MTRFGETVVWCIHPELDVGAKCCDARRGVSRRASSCARRAQGSAGDGRPFLLEATAAVDRPVEPGYERHGCIAAAARARDGGHLAAAARRALAAPVDSAGRAALRLVEQAFFKVEPLFSRRKDETPFAIATSQ